MEEIVKQCVGIDSAKQDFVVTFSVCDQNREIKRLSSHKFTNTEQGFKALSTWVDKLCKKSVPLLFVMESTGVYHERLAFFLHSLNHPVSIVVPKRAKDFSKTLGVKKVTDKIASDYLAVMGLEKKLDLWIPAQKEYRDLRHMTREKEQIQHYITIAKNQLEAERSGQMVSKSTIKRLEEMLKFLKKQRLEVLAEIKTLISSDAALKEKVTLLTSIPGVGEITAATIIGETNGFNQTRNKRQLVSYAGYDVINQESGTSIKTKARMSKRGNKNIRKAMHMPALAAIRSNEQNKATFIRIVNKTGIKMKAVVAVQRKLLVLMYTLWKNNTRYEPEYEQKKGAAIKPPHELDLVRSSEPLSSRAQK